MNAEWMEVDDLKPVSDNTHPNLLAFMRGVQAKIPGIQFGQRGPSATSAVFAYLPGEHVTMGRIGYGDFKVRGKGTAEYIVESDYINNCKYSSSSRQHHMAMTKDREKAVTNAQKFLRRMPTSSVAVRLFAGANAFVHDRSSKLRDAAAKAESKVFTTSLSRYGSGAVRIRLLAEMQRLIDTDHIFSDPSFGTDLAAMLTARAEYDALKDGVEFTFVGVKDTPFGQQIEVIDLDKYGCDGSDVRIFTEADMPTDLAGKVAVLSMLQPREYVDGVGCRRTERVFYVVR